MQTSESEKDLVFDQHAIRLMIGFIALLFPWVVTFIASRITDSISWSYHTGARDYFVGLLFVIGAFLMSYQGHKPLLDSNDVGKVWKSVSKVWKGAINFRIWEKKHEEDLVGWVGGVAAWVTAVYPTSLCLGYACPFEMKSTIHYIGAIILFSTTVYFCLVAFRGRAKAKLRINQGVSAKEDDRPQQLRMTFYSFCGWGIAVIMVGLLIAKSTKFDAISNITFWAEAVALELFGVAWMIASQYLPVFTNKTERQKLF